jgi:energy-coupling factor transporter ATP-binding protein EcfA2
MFMTDTLNLCTRLFDASRKEKWYRDGLMETLRIYLLDEKGQFDSLAQKILQTTSILARPWVLYQWFSVFLAIHPFYSDLDLPPYDVFAREIDAANGGILESGTQIDDQKTLRHEAGIGSDVGKAQQSEETMGFGLQVEPGEDPPLIDTRDVVVPCSFVLDSPLTAMFDNKTSKAAQLLAAVDFIDLQATDMEKTARDTNKESAVEDGEIAIETGDTPQTRSLRVPTQDQESDKDSMDEYPLAEMERDIRTHTLNRLYSCRSGDLLSEMTKDDYGLTTAFPTVFLMGKAYNRAAGNLSKKQLHHLLHQFTNVPARNKQLLCYLHDVKSRFEVINGVNAHVKSNKKAISSIKEILESQEERKALSKAVQDPNGPEAKGILDKLMSNLQFCARKMNYTTVNGKFNMMQMVDMSRFYGPPCGFFTLSFADTENPRALRTSYHSMNNTSFPAMFEEGCVHGGDATEFMKLLYEASSVQSSGNVVLPVHLEHTREYRANSARNNPIAYVAESKKMISDFCSILLGLPPENFFGSDEGQSRRRTRYFATYKGLLGHPLAYLAVVEDHAKGTIHYHLIFFGSLPPYLLQRFASLESVCKTIGKTLDTMYRAKLPSSIHIQHLTKKIIKEMKPMGLNTAILRRYPEPHLLSRHHPLDGTECFDTICQRTLQQAVDQQNHTHMYTCHKGIHGYRGCRLSRGLGFCDGTHCSLLRVIREDEEANFEDESRVFGDPTEEGKYNYDVMDPVPTLPGRAANIYRTKNPLSQEEYDPDNIVVWELDRPMLPPLFADPSMVDRDMFRQTVLPHWRDSKVLGEGTTIWNWLRDIPEGFEKIIAQALDANYSKANSYVVEHNPIASYCLGSHNNVQMLGTAEQAEAAMYYVGPYMTKSKFPLLHSLTLLEDVIKDVKNHPSTAKDSGTLERTAKHILTRMINKINLKMELSEYQIAASLLGLPSVICSDSFVYSDPRADMAYRNLVQLEENRRQALDEYIDNIGRASDHRQEPGLDQGELDFMVDDEPLTASEVTEAEGASDWGGSDLLLRQDATEQNLGRIRTFTIGGGTEEEEGHTRKILVPLSSFYPSRGKDLAEMNRDEYAALVEIKPATQKTAGEPTGRQRQKRFSLAPDHPLYPEYEQVLRGKHKINVATSKYPRHPGKRPTSDGTSNDAVAAWTRNANYFARFYLTKFRPEVACCEINESNYYGYEWEDLQQWIETCQRSSRIIDKFRVMALDRIASKMRATYEKKQVLSKYRSRNRDLWSDEELMYHKAEQAREDSFYEILDDSEVLDQYSFEQKHHTLSPQRNANLVRKLQQVDAVTGKLRAHLKPKEEASDGGSIQQPVSPGKITFPVAVATIEELDKAKSITEEGELSESSVPNTNSDISISPIDQARSYLDTTYLDEGLNMGQREIIEHFFSYLFDVEDDSPSARTPDSLVFVTGAAGTGKSTIIRHINRIAKIAHGVVINTSFNAINAIVMAGKESVGHTTASLVPMAMDKESSQFSCLNENQLAKFRKLTGLDQEKWREKKYLLIVDEVSNQASWHLGRLSRSFQQAMENYTKLFGGIGVLMTGDLGQLGPVKASPDLAKAAITYNQMLEEKNHMPQRTSRRKGKTKTPKQDDDNLMERTQYVLGNEMDDMGAAIMMQARWFELWEQLRAIDEQHQILVETMYARESVTVDDFRSRYPVLAAEEITAPNSPWLKASILAATNRERISFTYEMAIANARAEGTVVIRWPCRRAAWQQKPDDCHMGEVLKDPCFYEYFVEGAHGFLTDKVNKELGLVNAQSVIYHSLGFESDEQKADFETKLSVAQAGDVITLFSLPACINVRLPTIEKLVENDESLKEAWLEKCSIDPHHIVIPITCRKKRSSSSSSKESNREGLSFTPVHGGQLFRPSLVHLVPYFPLELAYSITVHKSQGRTLDRIIIALGDTGDVHSRMRYEHIYVAISRVHRCNDIRLLLPGKNEQEEIMSLVYVASLKPNAWTKRYFDGFTGRGEERSQGQWLQDVWDPKRAPPK